MLRFICTMCLTDWVAHSKAVQFNWSTSSAWWLKLAQHLNLIVCIIFKMLESLNLKSLFFLDRLDISALQKRRHGLIYQIVVPGSIVCEWNTTRGVATRLACLRQYNSSHAERGRLKMLFFFVWPVYIIKWKWMGLPENCKYKSL